MVEVRVNSYEYYLDRYNDNVTLFIDAVVEVNDKRFKVVVEADREHVDGNDIIGAVKRIVRTAEYSIKWYVEEIVHELAKKLGILNKIRMTDELLFDMIVQVIGETAKKHVDNPYYCVEKIEEKEEE